MTTLTRRKALAAVAAAPAAVALSAVPAQSGPSELAALIRRYLAKIDVFNATHHETDKEANAHAKVTYEETEKQMIGLPARTGEDALAAVDLIIEEARCSIIEFDDESHLHGSLIHAVRGYLKGRAA